MHNDDHPDLRYLEHYPDSGYALSDLMVVAASVRNPRSVYQPPRGFTRLPCDVFQAVVDALDAAGVNFVVEGGWAMNAWGYTRATFDIDVVVSVLREQSLAAFRAVSAIADENISVDAHDEDSAVSRRSARYAFLVGGWRVDLARTEIVEAFSDHATRAVLCDREVQVMHPRHLVARKRQRLSPKDRLDIAFLNENYPDWP